MPRVALFVPCYIDQFYPDVAWATLEVLERHGVRAKVPEMPTCCGQPMANTGCVNEARPLAEQFVEVLGRFDHVVCPSGSCTAMVRQHYEHLLHGRTDYVALRNKTWELTEYLLDVLRIDPPRSPFPYRVGLHQSCHGLRELRLGSSSETVGPRFSKAQKLLESMQGIQLVKLTRPDECCGFGGTFAVQEEAISCRMGLDRIHDHEQAGTEVLTANDMSCLMHLDGLLRRDRRPIRVLHIAQILAGRTPN
ncbi:MAG: (Fe-S)-binding protein [Planctomycetes bacterium]|nr:(Fe-S)-binding protein [Planctomycetota bacterium]